jgi:hypothetical protein
MATKQKARRIDIVRHRRGWAAETRNGRTFASGTTKKAVVRNAAAKAGKGTRPTTVRIHARDGRIQEERTYPPAAYSRTSRG